MKYLVGWFLICLLIVAAQPILGWSEIPKYFNHSLGWAAALGALDGLLLSSGLIVVIILEICNGNRVR